MVGYGYCRRVDTRRKASQERHSEKVTWKLHAGGHTGTGQAKSREHGIQGCCELRPVSTYHIPDLIPEPWLVILLEPSQKCQGCRTSPIVEMSKARLRVAGKLAQIHPASSGPGLDSWYQSNSRSVEAASPCSPLHRDTDQRPRMHSPQHSQW